MASKKSTRRNKKYKPQTRTVSVPLLHKLTVQESTIKTLKSRHDAILLRLYLATDTLQDRCELFSVLRLGQVLSKYADNAEEIHTRIEEGIQLLSHLPEPSKSEKSNLDLIKEGLELCEDVWRHVSVEEFVREAQKLKQSEANNEENSK